MLENIPSQSNIRRVFRLANMPTHEDFIDELELDPAGADELRELLAEGVYSIDLEELLDSPFRRRVRFPRQTRFSDGSFPVFYSSLDNPTAEAETKYWLRRYIGQPRNPRTAYYQRFGCTFDGLEKDLRSKIEDWPHLIQDQGYTFCNKLGAEAKESGLDGLVTLSARRRDGVNQPIFSRQAISNAKLDTFVAMTYNPDTDDVSVKYVTD